MVTIVLLLERLKAEEFLVGDEGCFRPAAARQDVGDIFLGHLVKDRPEAAL